MSRLLCNRKREIQQVFFCFIRSAFQGVTDDFLVSDATTKSRHDVKKWLYNVLSQ